MKLPKFLRRKQESPIRYEPQCTRCLDDGTRCPNRAKWAPLFWFRAVGYPDGEEAMAQVSIGVCDDHKDDEYMLNCFRPSGNPDGARQIRLHFREQGKAEPDLENARLEWRRLLEPQS